MRAIDLLEHIKTSTNCNPQSARTPSHSAIQQNSRNKLLNLTGFFSGTPVADVELILWDSLVEDMGPDQGKRLLRRKCE
jgi:hypothetical protein